MIDKKDTMKINWQWRPNKKLLIERKREMRLLRGLGLRRSWRWRSMMEGFQRMREGG